jgi:two-component system, chemotaxis family, chemotaxis protein CheY
MTHAVVLTDSPTMNSVLEQQLSSCGISTSILTSENATFLQQVILSKPDMIFLSTSLKNAQGVEICSLIKLDDRLKKTKVFILSTNVSDKEIAINHLANQFLTVPFSHNELSLAIKSQFLSRSRVLYVDDSKLCHHRMKPLLENQQYAVTQAWNGEEALQRLTEQTFDLVVMDVDMPILDGISVCKTMQSSPSKQTPVLLLSSHSDTNVIQRGFAAGAASYLIKPTTPDIFLPKIAQLIETKNSGRREKIQIIGQQSNQRDLIQIALAEAGFMVQISDSNSISLNKVLSSTFDLMFITDSGLNDEVAQLCLKARQTLKTRFLPIIALSNQTNKIDQVKYDSVFFKLVVRFFMQPVLVSV